MRETSTTVTLDARVSDRVTLQGALGAIVGGRLDVESTRHDVLPGWVVAVAAAYRLYDGGGAAPFVLLNASLGFASARTREQIDGASSVSLTSGDLRVGVVVGWTVAEILSPYLAARAFGGPVFWTFAGEKISGGDRYHYQFGAGLAVRFGDRLDAYVEGAPLGEKRASVGIGVAF